MPLVHLSHEYQAPIVKSKASPPGELLMAVRAMADKDEGVRGFFLQFRKEQKSVEWLRDVIALPLFAFVDSDVWSFEQVLTACQYLADEFNQLPSDGFFMVNTETGKVDAVFSEDDLIDPGMLPRESGDMAQALKRLSPVKEAAVISYNYEKGHAKQVLQELARRSQDQGLQHEADVHFKMATRQGRRSIAKDLSEEVPKKLLLAAGGTAGAFLRHFSLQDGDKIPSEGYIKLSGTASYRSQIGVQDALTINVSYNRLGSLKAGAAQGWIRDICRTLSKWAHDTMGAVPMGIEDIVPGDLKRSQLWVASPDALVAFKHLYPKVDVVPVEGALPVGLSNNVGWLEVDPEFRVESQERFQRWEVVASVGYTLHINVKREGLQTLLPLDIPSQTEVV